MEFHFPTGGIVRAPNISPDADTGIGTWTTQFVPVIHRVRKRDPAPAR